MRVECHTVALCAFESQQSDVVLPPLTVVLSVDNNAFGGQGTLKVVLLLSVVVTQAQHIASWVSAKPGRAKKKLK